MQNRQKYEYGLEFSEGTVSLVQIQDATRFVFVDKARVDGPDFAAKMKEFHRKITSQDERMVILPVFLRRIDTPTITAHIDPEKDRDTQIEDRLFRHSDKAMEEIEVIEGEEEDEKLRLIYVSRDLLSEAATFLEHFNFSPAYFTPRKRVVGFDKPIKFSPISTSPRKLPLYSGLGIAAALLLGAMFLFSNMPGGEDAQAPVETAATVQETPEPADPEPAIIEIAGDPIAQPSAPAQLVLADLHTTWVTGTTLDFNSTSLSLSTPARPALAKADPLINLTGILGEAPKYVNVIEDSPPTDPIKEQTAELTDTITETVEADADATETDLPVQPEIEVARAEESTQSDIEAVIEDDISEATRGGAMGTRPLLRPANLKAIEPEVEDTTTADAIENDLLEQAITTDSVAQVFEGATKNAAIVSARPPKKTTRWVTNLALVTESKRVASASVATEAATQPETNEVAAASTEKDARRVSNTYRKNQLSLIGVVGAPSSRRAIFRTSSGSIRTIKQGQRIAGWQLVAVGESSVKVVRQGKEKTMRLP